jgi:mevalonate kinase
MVEDLVQRFSFSGKTQFAVTRSLEAAGAGCGKSSLALCRRTEKERVKRDLGNGFIRASSATKWRLLIVV